MAEKIPGVWRTTMKRRLAVTAAAVVFWVGAIEVRLIQLQVFRHAELTKRAQKQQSRTDDIPAKRGELLDRRGQVLASSVDADTIYAVPGKVEDVHKATESICAALGDCDAKGDRQAILDRLLRTDKDFVYVRRLATPEQKQRVEALELDAIGFTKEDKRFYPNTELAAHVLGYVGTDQVGLGGIEATYDRLIKGTKGSLLVHNDEKRKAFSSRVEKAPTAGASLELTIDENLQHIVERELRAGVQENRAVAGSALILDPGTGEILALANFPTFNPNTFQASRREVLRNRAVQDSYEPGSTFKIVTAAAALEYEVVHANDLIDVSGGKIVFGPRDVVRDTHVYRTLTFSDVIVKSSNVGAIKVALRLGRDRLTKYVRLFGFGRPSSPCDLIAPCDFPAEAGGTVWDAAKLNDRALARVSIGYQVAVTPLQMAAAVSSIANGGELIQPRVVRAVIKDGVRKVVPRKVVNRTVTPRVAAELTTIMEGVVTDGTATMAQIPGYTVAGKTGTAEKWSNGRYLDGVYNASFVGFVPSRAPVYTIIVVIDSPHGRNGYYGGPVAGPIFKRIAEAALRYGGVPRTLNPPTPLLVNRRPETGTVERPVSGPAQSPHMSRTSAAVEGLFPDVTGMSSRDALFTLSRLGLKTQLSGTGLVQEQRPVAGTQIEPGVTVTLWLAREQPVVRTADTTRP